PNNVQQGSAVQVIIVRLERYGDRPHHRSRMIAKIREHETGGLEGSVAIAQGDPDAGVAEAYDIGPVVPVQVCEIAGVQRNPPTLVEAELGQDQLRTASSRYRYPDSVVAEADDIGLSITRDVGRKAGMVFDAPSLVVAHLGKNKRGGPEGS